MNSWWEEQHQRRRAAITAVLDSQRGHQYLDYADGDRAFVAWLLVADTICVRRFALSIFDLADWAWRAAPEAGDRPGAALREALHSDDTAAMLMDGE